MLTNNLIKKNRVLIAFWRIPLFWVSADESYVCSLQCLLDILRTLHLINTC